MLTIQNIHELAEKFPQRIHINELDYVYEFVIDNPNYLGGKNGIWQPISYVITLARVHPVSIGVKHIHHNEYLLMHNHNEKWLKKEDITNIDLFVEKITEVVAGYNK